MKHRQVVRYDAGKSLRTLFIGKPKRVGNDSKQRQKSECRDNRFLSKGMIFKKDKANMIFNYKENILPQRTHEKSLW